MGIYLSHLSALRYWRSVGHPRVIGAGLSCEIARALGRPSGTARIRRIPEGPPDVALVRDVAGRAFAGVGDVGATFGAGTTDDVRDASAAEPLHVLVARNEDRRPSRGIVCHALGADLPSGSLVRLASPDVYVSSPGLCLIQLAATLPDVELTLLACEFCGMYGPSRAVPHGLFGRTPLSSVASLRTYASKASHLKGCRRVRLCLAHALDRSASPMESILALSQCLPMRRGGAGLPAPLLNHRVELTPEARLHCGKRHFVYDLHWPGLNVAAEYDSDAAHALDPQRDNDSVRRAIIQAMGEQVVTVRTNQLFDPQLMADVTKALERAMGLYRRERVADYGARRERLYRELLAPWTHPERPSLFGPRALACPQPAGWRAPGAVGRGRP